MMVFVNLLFEPQSPLFVSLKNYVYFSQFTPLLDESINLLIVLVTVNPISHLILLNGPKSQTRLLRFEVFPENKMFCNKPTPSYTTQYTDLFLHLKKVLTCTLVNVILFN